MFSDTYWYLVSRFCVRGGHRRTVVSSEASTNPRAEPLLCDLLLKAKMDQVSQPAGTKIYGPRNSDLVSSDGCSGKILIRKTPPCGQLIPLLARSPRYTIIPARKCTLYSAQDARSYKFSRADSCTDLFT